MFTSKVGTNDSRLLKVSNLAARHPRKAPHNVIQAIMSEGLAQSPTWRLEWDSILRSCGRKALNLLLSHHAPRISIRLTHSYLQRTTNYH